MKRSTDRILTTHTGSLPRPKDLAEMLRKLDAHESLDEAEFQQRVRSAVAETVALQRKSGIDVVNDGEEGKVGYSTYIKDRCTGFEGENRSTMVQAEGRDFPDWAAARNRPTMTRPATAPSHGRTSTPSSATSTTSRPPPRTAEPKRSS